MGEWEINQDKLRIQTQIFSSNSESKNLNYMSYMIFNKLNIAFNIKRMN